VPNKGKIMGHYASEMGIGDTETERAQKLLNKQKMLMNIRNDIEDRSIEEVLADIVNDPQMYRIHSRRESK
jgi:hypothetical protein